MPTQFPGVSFYFLPADIITQVLNFGLPAPVDVMIEGADVQGNRQWATAVLAELHEVPGLTDLRIQQTFDYPKFDIAVDRTKAASAGFTLLFRSEGLRVAVVRSGRAELVPVKIGRDVGSSVEIVSGLGPGDAVITDPGDSRASGTPVRIQSPPAGKDAR